MDDSSKGPQNAHYRLLVVRDEFSLLYITVAFNLKARKKKNHEVTVIHCDKRNCSPQNIVTVVTTLFSQKMISVVKI